MQLTYRGAQYEYNPRNTEAIREANVFRAIRPSYNLHYRGAVYTVDPNAEPSLPSIQPAGVLTYRGVSYTLNGGARDAAAVRSQAGAVSTQPRFQQKAASNTEFATIHRSNLRTNVQRRLQVARERGDQTLVSLLERELQEIV
ncbi:MAG: DUF4278 domain-containing protein [Leptolyngbya sp. BL-A-14]